MSKVLVPGPHYQLSPVLAKEIGVNEAIVLQQLHYLIESGAGTEAAGRQWVYMTVSQWHERYFPFWSIGTVRRALERLQELKLIIVDNHNRTKYDRTLWYTIDYTTFAKTEERICTNSTNGSSHNDKWNSSPEDTETNNPSVQNEQNDVPKTSEPIHKDIKEKERERIYMDTPVIGGISVDADLPEFDPVAYEEQVLMERMTSAISKEVRDTLAPGKNEDEFKSVALGLMAEGYGPEDVKGFNTWWQVNSWYKNSEMISLDHLLSHFKSFKAGISLRSNQSPPAKTNGHQPAYEPVGGVY